MCLFFKYIEWELFDAIFHILKLYTCLLIENTYMTYIYMRKDI